MWRTLPQITITVPYRESVVSLKRKYMKSSMDSDLALSQPSVDGILDSIAQDGCGSLLEEVFLDLEVWIPLVSRQRGPLAALLLAHSVLAHV